MLRLQTASADKPGMNEGGTDDASPRQKMKAQSDQLKRISTMDFRSLGQGKQRGMQYSQRLPERSRTHLRIVHPDHTQLIGVELLPNNPLCVVAVEHQPFRATRAARQQESSDDDLLPRAVRQETNMTARGGLLMST